MEAGDISVIQGTINRCLHNSSNFKIYSTNVDKVEVGVVVKNPIYNTLTFKGDVQELNVDSKYEIELRYEGKDPRFGHQYTAIRVSKNRPTTIEQTKSFLSEFISIDRANTLVEAYPNIVDMVLKNEPIDTSKLKGVKDKTLDKIRDKIIENIGVLEVHKHFSKYGIPYSVIKKILIKYKSVDNAIYQINKNPYKALTSLNGIGFKKADDIALKINPSFINSQERIAACILFYLDEYENNGNTYIDTSELYGECLAIVEESINHFKLALSDRDIFYDKDKSRVAKLSTRNKEEFIADCLMVAKKTIRPWKDIDLSRYTQVDGFDLTEEQQGTLVSVVNNGVTCLTAPAGCVDKDTEYFNGYEWKKISEYVKGEKVLQFGEGDCGELVDPLKYIKLPCEEFYHLKTMYGLNQMLSEEHRVITYSVDEVEYKYTMKEFVRLHNESNLGINKKFKTTFNYNSGKGIDLSDNEIRLMVAIMADASFNSSEPNSTWCRFHLKKDRKEERLEALLNTMGKEYTKSTLKEKRYHDYYLYSPIRMKQFPKEWYNCSKKQFEVICDEVLYWDGSVSGKRNSYSTTIKSDADFIQFAFATIGKRATIHTQDRRGQEYLTCGEIYTRKSTEYNVTISSKSPYVGFCSKSPEKKINIPLVKSEDGYKYCFTVPSGKLILRRGDRIFITGNCGKSFGVKAIVDMLDDYKKTYSIMTPTGKSSLVLQEYVGRNVKTIHRALGYNGTGFTLDESNKLNVDVVIIDEFSMVSIHLLSSLLKALNMKKTRLVLVSDPAQLASVGAGNSSYDTISSGVIPVTNLTKVFRYGDGGLMNVATKIRNSEKFLDNDFVGTKIFGANQDYCYLEMEQDLMLDKTLEIYAKLLSVGNTIENIMVVTSKNVGKTGTRVINSKIQEMLHRDRTKQYIEDEHKRRFYLGDKVKQNKNNYDIKIMIDNERITKKDSEFLPVGEVFNGMTGIVVRVFDNQIHVKFGEKIFLYYKEEFETLDLGYSISAHASQGSGVDNVIMLSPRADTFMLSSNLLYVMCTRAKKRVYHLGNIGTVNSSIRKKENLLRNTFLQELLIEKDK